MHHTLLSYKELAASGWQPQVQVTAVDWPLRLRAKDILRSQGVDPDQVKLRRPALYTMAERLQGDAPGLLAPKLTYRIYSVKGSDEQNHLLSGGGTLARAPISEYVRDVHFFIMLIFTIGEELDRQIQERSKQRLVEGLMLDALGNAAMSQFSHMIRQAFQGMVRKAETGALGLLIQPGIRDWPIEEGQQAIFGLVEGSAIGVKLKESSLMTPGKTCSGIMAVGTDVVTPDQIAPCEMCMMKSTCPYRGTYTHD